MIADLLIIIIKTLRPLLGPSGCCKFDISCGNFAILILKEKSLIPAVYTIFKRLLSCNPFF